MAISNEQIEILANQLGTTITTQFSRFSTGLTENIAEGLQAGIANGLQTGITQGFTASLNQNATVRPPMQTFQLVKSDKLLQTARFNKWKIQFEANCVQLGITDNQKKADAITVCLGPDAYYQVQLKNKPEAKRNDENQVIENPYELQLRWIEMSLCVQQSQVSAQSRFESMFPEKGETFDDFFNRIAEIAELCNFENKDERILKALTGRYHDREWRRYVQRKNLNLDQALDYARQLYDWRLQDKIIDENRSSQQSAKVNNIKPNNKRSCYNCGETDCQHGQSCRAFGVRCYGCGRYNHLAKYCRSKSSSNYNKRGNSNFNKRGHFKKRGHGSNNHRYNRYNQDNQNTRRTSFGGRRGSNRGYKNNHYRKTNKVQQDESDQSSDNESQPQDSFVRHVRSQVYNQQHN